MEFIKKDSGTIYNVTNEALIEAYKADERFEVKGEKPEKKTTAKK